MFISKIKKLELKVSVPLKCLNRATLRKLIAQKKRQPLKIKYCNDITEQADKMTSETVEASDTQQDAHLLLSLSTSGTNNLFLEELKKPNQNKINDETVISKNNLKPPQSIQKDDEVILVEEDEQHIVNSYLNKVTVPKPIKVKKTRTVTILRNGAKKITKQDKIRCVSNEDFECLKLIKATGLTRCQILKLKNDSNLSNNRNDTNNNQLQHADETFDDGNATKLKELIKTNNQNKQFLNMIAEQMHKYRIIQFASDHRAYYEQLIDHIYKISKKPSSDKGTQTDRSRRVTSTATMNEEGHVQMRHQIQNTMTSVSLPQTLLPHQVPVSPVPGDQASGLQSQPQMTKPANMYTSGFYPNTPMISALQLTEPLYQQQRANADYAINRTRYAVYQPMQQSSANYDIQRSIPQQHANFMTATAHPATAQATFPIQQASAHNSNYSQEYPVNLQSGYAVDHCQISNKNNSAFVRFNTEREIPQHSRPPVPPKKKMTMVRNTPYEPAIPQFPQHYNKYQSIMEQQKIDQMQMRSLQMSYPNTAWNHAPLYARQNRPA